LREQGIAGGGDDVTTERRAAGFAGILNGSPATTAMRSFAVVTIAPPIKGGFLLTLLLSKNLKKHQNNADLTEIDQL